MAKNDPQAGAFRRVTVQELIEQLQALPAEQKRLPVHVGGMCEDSGDLEFVEVKEDYPHKRDPAKKTFYVFLS